MAKKKPAAKKKKSAVKKPTLKKGLGAAGAVLRNLVAEAAPAVRDWPLLEVFSPGKLSQARKTVAGQFGKTFADKSSDRFCEALATVQSFALESDAPQPRPTILEFRRPQAAEADILNRAAAIAGALATISPALRGLARRNTLRDGFYRQLSPVRSELERLSPAHLAAGLEAMASPTTPSTIVELCWLNGTARTFLDPLGLREVAGEPTLERLDLPRPLTPDITGTALRVGAPAFRNANGVDGRNIVVAVIDSEVDLSHPAFGGRAMHKTNHTKERFGQPDSHGTAVAGIIGSSDPARPGIAPGVTIANYKILATDRSLNADDFGGAMAIQQALEDGAHIANCSWGAGLTGDGTSRECVACNEAWEEGLIIVKSAGNRGPSAGSMTTPADADGVIVVGATDRNGAAIPSFSSRGPAAGKARPHLVAPGGTPVDGMLSCMPGGGFGNVGHGTSYAAPHVSGLIALMLAGTPGLEPDQVRDNLIALCNLLAAGGAQDQGAGFVSF